MSTIVKMFTYDDKKNKRLQKGTQPQNKVEQMQPKKKKRAHIHDRFLHPQPKKIIVNEQEYGY